jgi:UDP-glucose 4-epimerase
VCRLGNVYGPRQNPHGEAGVVAIFSDHLYTGKAPKLYGHGRPTRDYVYVGDVVKALLAATGRAGTYNIATGVETDVVTIWRELQSAAEQSSADGRGERAAAIQPELADLRPGELQHSRLDIGRARQELGWQPEVAIERGLRMTYEALVEEFEQAK